MFFFLPIGHDQPVYDRPWVTIALILLCSGIFFGSCAYTAPAMSELEAAAVDIDRISERYPEARVSFTIEGLPPQLDAPIRTLVDERPDRSPRLGDVELEAAMLRLVNAMNRLPTLRFGYRPGAPTVTGALGHVWMHADIFHLLGNMLLLWVAGGVLECFWRRWAFILLYVLSGLAGMTAHHLANAHSLVPMIGASGAIAGLIGAFIVGYPRSRIRIAYFVLVLFKPFYGTWLVPAWIVIPLWAGTELVSALWGSADGVAYWAHVGGFAVGVVAALLARSLKLVAVDAGFQLDNPRKDDEERPAA